MNKRNRRMNTMDQLPTNNSSETDAEKVILAQVQYCRFLNLVYDEMKSSGLDHLRELSNQIGKKIL